MTKILILCTGNSCRSQMAQAILQSFDPDNLVVYSAGTHPAAMVHPLAVQVMTEAGYDLSGFKPKHVDRFLGANFDYVITVCGSARETCPLFTGQVNRRLHIGFDDPAIATGSPEQILQEFRRIRDEIRDKFARFYQTQLKST